MGKNGKEGHCQKLWLVGRVILRFQDFLSERFVDLRISLLLSFFVPLLMRSLPEVLMGGYIVGFDTISYYVPVVWKWVNYGVGFWEFFGCAPLFYLLLSGLALIGVPLTVSLKVLPVLLHGFLGVAVFLFAVKGLDWSFKEGLVVSLFSTLYFVGLRISWDMLRSELGLIFLFVFFIALRRCLCNFTWKRVGFLLFSMVLVVLAHQLVSVIMFMVVLAVALEEVLRRGYSFVWRLFLAALPAMVFFGLTVYADYVVLPGFSDGVVAAGRVGWLSLLGCSSVTAEAVNTVGFLFLCYLPVFPFVFLGFRRLRSLELKVWFVWCFLGMLLPFLFSSAPLGYRWVLLLLFPLAFFAVEGYKRLGGFGLLRKALVGFMVFLSFCFVFLPAEFAFPYFSVYSCYVPSSMLQNSVPLSDCGDVVRVFGWVDVNVGDGGVLLVHDVFHGWALLCLNDGVGVLRYGYASPVDAALVFSEQGYGRLFLVWWVSGEGWHGVVSLPSSFRMVFRSGRIAVYEWVGV